MIAPQLGSAKQATIASRRVEPMAPVVEVQYVLSVKEKERLMSGRRDGDGGDSEGGGGDDGMGAEVILT